MFKPTAIAIPLLTLFLAACGGSGGGSDVVSNETTNNNEEDGGSTTVDNGDGTSDDVTTNTSIDNPRLGTGSGASFSVGSLEITNNNLSAGGTTNISANIVDIDSNNAKIVSTEYEVEFSSSCSAQVPAKASFSRQRVRTSSGEVSVTYEAQGCSGTDIISFRLFAPGATGDINTNTAVHTATGTLTVASPEVGAITFGSVSAPAISISTIANSALPKFSSITFIVLDETNNPIEGKTVNFELTNSAGGISLALPSAITNESGEAIANIRSGTANAITSVVATTLANDNVTEISTNSLPVAVTTGLADQDSFEVVANILNPGSYDFSGVEVEVTAFVGDQFQNPVPDNTIVNFTAESGLIPPSCLTLNGSCSVTWRSTGYRPGQERDPEYSGLNRVNETDPVRGSSANGLTTILAYTEGEAGFTDSNNNGVYDTGESFEAFAEAVRDDDKLNLQLNSDTTELDVNANGPIEFFADYDSDGIHDLAPTLYQGALCSDAARSVGHCGSMMHVRDSVVISQATIQPNQILLFESANGRDFTLFNGSLGASGSFFVYIADQNLSKAAASTSLSVTGDGYEIFGRTGDVGNDIGLLDSNFTGLPSRFGDLFLVNYVQEGAAVSIEVTITAPGGSISRLLTP
ncbi:Ig-like domain-containing protein [Bacterioplanoides sp.]|uniref:Ig-like domain-containing protein n=1 Tax=Bacterioplanoides sp. TaxID=2066072 RepID=UPI003AFFAD6C